MRWLALVVLLGCTEKRPVSEPLAPLEVEVAGCREISAEACAVEEHAMLTLWIGAAAPTLYSNGAPVRHEQTSIDGGVRVRADVGPGRLEARAERFETWSLTIARFQEDPQLGLHRQRAREARNEGRVQEAIAHFEKALEEDRRNGRFVSFTQNSTALAYVYLSSGYRYEEAARVLASFEGLPHQFAQIGAERRFAEASLYYEFVDMRGALSALRSTLRTAERLGIADLEIDVLQLMLGVQSFAAEWRSVRDTAAELRTALGSSNACKRAEIATNVGWHSMLGRSRAEALFSEWPRTELELAAAIYRSECDDPSALVNAEINLAWLELLMGRPKEARRHLAAALAVPLEKDPKTQGNLLHVEAEIALADDPSRALDAFTRLDDLARRTRRLGLLHQAIVGRGRALEDRGRRTEAVAAYREAESVLDEMAARIPWGEGRGSFLMSTGLSTERLLRLSLSAGKLDDAVRVIRRSNLRALRNLNPAEKWSAERARAGSSWTAALSHYLTAQAELDAIVQSSWRAPKSEQRAVEQARARVAKRVDEALDGAIMAGISSEPENLGDLTVARGEAAVFIHPADREWVVIAKLDHRTEQRLLSRTASASEAASALVSLAPELERRKVHLYVHPSAEQLDWHSFFPATMTSYVVDLTPSSTVSAKRALVLGDPAEAVPSSKEEARAVVDLLRAAKWSVDHLEVTSRGRLREALERELELFHYSGHGVVRGAEGLQGGLPLQSEEYFAVADVLTLHRVPRVVVLSACSLAQQVPESESIGMSMAHAFLLRGSQVVIAAPREVSSRTARAIIETAHRRRLDGVSWEEALLAGERAARARGLADAGVFRVLSRR